MVYIPVPQLTGHDSRTDPAANLTASECVACQAKMDWDTLELQLEIKNVESMNHSLRLLKQKGFAVLSWRCLYENG